MERIAGLLDTVLNRELIRAVISNPREKEGIIKVRVRPLEKKGGLFFQFESFTEKQAFHKNLRREEAKESSLSARAASARCRSRRWMKNTLS